MALINCKLCNNRISTRAEDCPKCGCPNSVRSDTQTASHQKKNCAECEHGGTDGGYSCNLCDTTLTSGFKPVTAVQGGSVSKNRRENDISTIAGLDLLVIIDELEINSSLKDVFVKIAATQSTSGFLGIRKYVTECSELKYFKAANTLSAISSNLALLTGPFYYIMFGIWRKGAVLLVMQLAALAGAVFGNQALQIVSLILLVATQTMVYCAAKYDRYRQLVLHETFWW